MRIDIYACKTKDDFEVGCGYQECRTALEAVMLELDGRFPDTYGMGVISAGDDDVHVSAMRIGEDRYEVHVYIGDNDSWFEYEIPQQ